MNEERIDVVVTLVRAVGDCPVEEYSLAVSPKCTVDKINHMLFAEVDWLHDKKDEYSLSLPDGAPLSVYFHRIGEVASIVAIHRAGQKARLLLLPNNIQQQPKAHTPPTIPKLSLSGGGIAPPALSLSPRGTVTTTVSSPRSLALVGSPRRHSFYPSSMFSLTEAEQSDIAAAKEAEIWKGNSSNHHNGGEYYGGRRESDDDIMGATIVGVKGRNGSGLKRANTKEEMVAAAATATMEKAKQVQEENERLRHRMNELEQQAKRREEEWDERQKAWAKEKEELLRALETFTQQKQNSEALIGAVEKEERKEKEKSEKRKSDKRKVSSKGNSHDGEELLLSTEEGGTPSKKKSKHKVKKASRSLKISEVKGLLSPTKHRKGSKTWDDRGDKQIGGVLHDNNLDSSNAEAGTNEAASDSPAAKKAERIKRKSKKEESSKDKVGEHAVEKGEAIQSPVEPATVADAKVVAIDGVPQQSPKEAPERSVGGSSEEAEQVMGDDGKGSLHERQRQGSFIIVEEEDARIDEDLLDSGSDTGSGVKLRSKAAGLKRTNMRGEERSDELSEGKIDEDEVEGNYNSEPEVSSDGRFSRRQSVAEFGSRGDDSSIGHDIDVDDEDDDEEHNTVSDEDSGREEWEGGKNKGVRRALRFAKTDTTWSEMRKRSEKKKWLQEKKERTRTSRWEELLKEQQETLKALQVHSCEIGAITSSAEVSFTSFSDLSMSAEAVVPTPLSAASEAPQPEPSSAAAASGEPAQDKVQESDATGGVQAYKTHQIRRLWFRRKNTLPRSLEELSAEYAAQKKELDERTRQWLEKRREKGEAPETDEREREREKQERKALRLRLFGGAEASVEGSSDDETASNGGDKKGTRQARALSVLIKKHGDDDGDDGDEKEKKRSESTRKNRKLAQSGGSATSSGSPRKSGSMIASVTPAKDKIHQSPDQHDFLKSASTGERLSPMIARKKEKAAKKQLQQQTRRNTTAVALAGSSPESTGSFLASATDSNDLDNDKTGSHISTASTNSSDLSAV